VRRVALVVLAALMLLTGYSLGRASEKDQAVLNVRVSSADHEVIEGYFSLGEQTTVMVKPGSDLHRFLARQRGRNITVTVTEAGGRELSRLDR
jgi:hypothetical protein